MVDEDVVDDAAGFVEEHAVVRAARGEMGHVPGLHALQEIQRRPRPLTSSLPMWSMSKSPAASRTRMCSSRGPVSYWTGMSHPPKSTMRAPARTCHPCSFVSMQPP